MILPADQDDVWRPDKLATVERALADDAAAGLVFSDAAVVGDDLRPAGFTLWESIARDVPDAGFRANGSMTIAQTDEQLRVLEEVATRPDAVERSLALVDAAAARELNPALQGAFLGALHCASDAAVEPRRVPGALRDASNATGRPNAKAARIASLCAASTPSMSNEGSASA